MIVGPEQFVRLLVHSALLTLFGGLVIAWMGGAALAYGFLFGGLWSTANFWVLKGLFEAILQKSPLWRVILWAQIKIPALYGLGAWILLTVPLSIVAALVGFHIPFLLLIVEAVYYQSKETSRNRASH